MREKGSQATVGRLVPRRKVPATLLLAGGERVEGELYVAIHGPDGPPETPIQRLNEPNETYFPIAVAHRHVLIRKSQILAVELPGDTPRSEAPHREGTIRELHVEVKLPAGPPLSGRIAVPEIVHARRALDYLNMPRPRFFLLVREDGATAVNDDHVVAVSEIAHRPV